MSKYSLAFNGNLGRQLLRSEMANQVQTNSVGVVIQSSKKLHLLT